MPRIDGSAGSGRLTIVRAGASRNSGPATALLDGIVGDSLAALGLRPGEARICSFDSARGTLSALVASEAPVPRLLVLGAGADAEPLVRFAAELGWLCTISDHRPAYVDANDFSVRNPGIALPSTQSRSHSRSTISTWRW